MSTVPDEFKKVIKDFVSDIKSTFPEYVPLISKWWKDEQEYSYIEEPTERARAIEKGQEISSKIVFEFCKKKLPPRFFDILYQNADIFKEDSEIDTEFLPHIHFKNLWQDDISDKTRETIWKYLQLIVFSIVGTLDNKEMFGDTAKIFEAINQDDFKNKLEETLSKMQEIFDKNAEDDKTSGGSFNMEDMPTAGDIHEHITGMLDGKLGKLAREIAEETAQSINIDMENATDMKDVLGKLIKNPTKLMSLVQNVGSKLDDKMKSGEIKESELVQEATEIMNKMKNMKGMSDIQAMLSKLGLSGADLGGLGGLGAMGGKLNTSAMEAQLQRNLKLAQQKERMKAKLDATKLAKENEKAKQPITSDTSAPKISDEELIQIFSEDANKSNNNPNKTNKSSKSKNKNNKKQ